MDDQPMSTISLPSLPECQPSNKTMSQAWKSMGTLSELGLVSMGASSMNWMFLNGAFNK